MEAELRYHASCSRQEEGRKQVERGAKDEGGPAEPGHSLLGNILDLSHPVIFTDI